MYKKGLLDASLFLVIGSRISQPRRGKTLVPLRRQQTKLRFRLRYGISFRKLRV